MKEGEQTTPRILVVDDNEAWRRLVPELLKFEGIENVDMQEADTAENGVKKFDEMVKRGEKPDLVLMDTRLPFLSGVDATEVILARDKDTNIYGFTIYEDIDNISKMIGAGAKGIISKRPDVKTIAKRIQEALKNE